MPAAWQQAFLLYVEKILLECHENENPVYNKFPKVYL